MIKETLYTKICGRWLKQYIMEMYCINKSVILKVGRQARRMTPKLNRNVSFSLHPKSIESEILRVESGNLYFIKTSR